MLKYLYDSISKYNVKSILNGLNAEVKLKLIFGDTIDKECLYEACKNNRLKLIDAAKCKMMIANTNQIQRKNISKKKKKQSKSS